MVFSSASLKSVADDGDVLRARNHIVPGLILLVNNLISIAGSASSRFQRKVCTRKQVPGFNGLQYWLVLNYVVPKPQQGIPARRSVVAVAAYA